jgi:hypothetical protein
LIIKYPHPQLVDKCWFGNLLFPYKDKYFVKYIQKPAACLVFKFQAFYVCYQMPKNVFGALKTGMSNSNFLKHYMVLHGKKLTWIVTLTTSYVSRSGIKVIKYRLFPVTTRLNYSIGKILRFKTIFIYFLSYEIMSVNIDIIDPWWLSYIKCFYILKRLE